MRAHPIFSPTPLKIAQTPVPMRNSATHKPIAPTAPENMPTIRRALPADADVLTRLMHASSAYRGAYASILEGYALSPAQIERDAVHVYEDAAAVLGFYSLTRRGDESELDLMFVADAAQGRGIGAALFAHLRALAEKCGVRTIRIVAHPPAEAFYLHRGARRVGTQAPAGKVAWPRPILALDVTVDGDAARPLGAERT